MIEPALRFWLGSLVYLFESVVVPFLELYTLPAYLPIVAYLSYLHEMSIMQTRQQEMQLIHILSTSTTLSLYIIQKQSRITF